MEPEVEIIETSPAVKMLCKLFVEKVQREQLELSNVIAVTEPNRISEGYKLNIEQGVWVRTCDKTNIIIDEGYEKI